MKRYAFITGMSAFCCAALLANNVFAWSLGEVDFATMNTDSDPWKIGFLQQPGGLFGAFTRYVKPSGENPLAYWDYGADDASKHGLGAMNPGATPYESSSYYEPGLITIEPGVGDNGVWRPGAIQWTAPQDGAFHVVATWSNQRISPYWHPVPVNVGAKINGASSDFFADQLDGFVGRAEAGFSDALGTHGATTYDGVLSLTAGQALSFYANTTDWGYNTTGLAIAISEVPEPRMLCLLCWGLLSIFGYAWHRKRG